MYSVEVSSQVDTFVIIKFYLYEYPQRINIYILSFTVIGKSLIIYACMCTRTYVHIYIYTSACVYVSMYACPIYVYIYVTMKVINSRSRVGSFDSSLLS